MASQAVAKEFSGSQTSSLALEGVGSPFKDVNRQATVSWTVTGADDDDGVKFWSISGIMERRDVRLKEDHSQSKLKNELSPSIDSNFW